MDYFFRLQSGFALPSEQKKKFLFPNFFTVQSLPAGGGHSWRGDSSCAALPQLTGYRNISRARTKFRKINKNIFSFFLFLCIFELNK
jgi:hypothetical protein